LEKIPGVEVECLSVITVSRRCYAKAVIHGDTETVGKVTYQYVGFLNVPVLKSVTSCYAMSRYLHRYLKIHRHEDTVVVCDPLLMEAAYACLHQCRRHRVTAVGFLTDIPSFTDVLDNHGVVKSKLYAMYNGWCRSLLKRFDSYVLLTEYMNNLINTLHKPYLLMECLVDCAKAAHAQPLRLAKPVVLYAGKFHKEFGLDILAEAASIVKTDCEFRLYGGSGNYTEELVKKSQGNKRLKVLGILPENEIMEAERQSTLLVNPRPAGGAFTRYSFPSKTAEYMLAGVPVLMYKLPGIPDEYDEYLYYAKEENARGFAQAIDDILHLPAVQRKVKAGRAQRFIMQEKNCVRQAGRLVDFLKKVVCQRNETNLNEKKVSGWL
jgi:glycosyltransferase involved in cell wall biosynthesis